MQTTLRSTLSNQLGTDPHKLPRGSIQIRVQPGAFLAILNPTEIVLSKLAVLREGFSLGYV
jgi:hypothetical protein